jgi:integrase
MAKRGVTGAYAVGTGDVRRHSVFKPSELSRAIALSIPNSCKSNQGTPTPRIGRDRDGLLGLHNFRHSLARFLSNGAKVQPKTVQGILRHAGIKTTLGLCAQNDSDEKQAAQDAFLHAMGLASMMV